MVLPLLIAAAGISAVGKVLGGIGANSAARARAKALEQGAQMDLDEAGVAAQLGLEDDERVAGSLAAAAGAGAGGGLQGSSMAVLDDLGRQSLMKARSTVYRGQTAAWARRSEAGQVRQQGKYELAGSVISAGSSLLGAFAKGS